MGGTYFFERGTSGFDEAWDGLARQMDAMIGDNQGRRVAYQSLKSHCRMDNQAIPNESVKGLMEIVLNGIPGNMDRCVMESTVLPGEHWQYMGTYQDQVSRSWRHEFRHRHLDIKGVRVTLYVPCHTPVPPTVPKVKLETVHQKPETGTGFRDNKEPF